MINLSISLPNNKAYILVFFLLIAFSCNRNNQQKQGARSAFYLKRTETDLIPDNSAVAPVNMPVDWHTLKKVPAGKPFITPFLNTIRIAGKPIIVRAGRPTLITPGAGNFLLPKTIPVLEKPVVACLLQTLSVKEMSFKKTNPSGFGSFGKLKG